MAFIARITLGTGDKVSADYQSSDCNVGVTWELERNDTNLLEFVEKKAGLLEEAHYLLRQAIIEQRQDRERGENHQEEPKKPILPKNGQRNGFFAGNGRHPNGNASKATEKQINTALSLQKEMGTSSLSARDLASLTKEEISGYIGDLLKERKKSHVQGGKE
jgi:hypothetical protein